MSDLEVLKEIPGYKAILKSVLKSQIQLLMEQLSEHAGEESIILTASVHDGSLSHLGSNTGKGFLEGRDEIKSQFLGYCLKTYHKKKTHEPQKPYQRTHPSPRSPAQISAPSAKRSRLQPVTQPRASPVEMSTHTSHFISETSDSNSGLGNSGAITDSIMSIKTEHVDNQGTDFPQHEQTGSSESVTFPAAQKTVPDSVHLSHTQTSGGGGESGADMDTANESVETENSNVSDISGIKVEQVEDELEITGVEMAAGSFENWGQGQDQQGYGPESDSSFDQSADQAGYSIGTNRTLWQFLLDLLASDNHKEIIQWTNNEGEFKIINPEEVAYLWGLQKNKQNMNYDKLRQPHREKCEEGISFMDKVNYTVQTLCQICLKTYSNKHTLARHQRLVHNVSSQRHKLLLQQSDQRIFVPEQLGNTCNICSKTFYQKEKYDAHINKHIEGKRFTCTTCSKQFYSKNSLKRHMMDCASNIIHACKMCKAKFRSRLCLDSHIKGKHGTVNVVCRCGKAFTWMNSFYRHKKICPAWEIS